MGAIYYPLDFYIRSDTMQIMNKCDVIIIGAGAAGLSAAAAATAQNKKVIICDMGDVPARKVMASGGGRCNITNTAAAANRYFGANPDFVRGALSRVSPMDIIDWAGAHNLHLFEKEAGRYFCQDGAAAVVDALIKDAQNAKFIFNTKINSINKQDNLFYLDINQHKYVAKSVIVATGGISFGTLGVSDAGYKIAKSFGHKIVPVRPALCGLAIQDFNTNLAGVSVRAELSINRMSVYDDMLFTHYGIGGPAAYRASLHDITQGIRINLIPNTDVWSILRAAKKSDGKKSMATILSGYVPNRVAKWLVGDDARNIADIKDSELKMIAERATNIFVPKDKISYHNMASAEVVRGGVATDEISSKTMESKLCSGLFFAGEVIDIAGDLGGFNLQWAWASGRVAGYNA